MTRRSVYCAIIVLALLPCEAGRLHGQPHDVNSQPKDAEGFHKRGRDYYAKREYDKAISDFNQAIQLDPKASGAFCGRGCAWHAKGEYDKAIKDFDEAIRLDPKCHEAFYGRGRAWHARGDYSKAIRDYDEAARLDPNDAMILEAVS
jgi:tetratricopeptide (TPR) repeat protein